MVLIDLEQYEQITFPDLNILQNSVEEVLVAFRCLKDEQQLLNELSGEFNKLIYERARESLKMSIIDDLLQTLTLLEDMAKNRERDLDKLETNFTDFINSLSSTSSRVQEQHDRNHLEYQTEIFQKVFNSSLDFIKYNQLKHERLITNKIKKYKKVISIKLPVILLNLKISKQFWKIQLSILQSHIYILKPLVVDDNNDYNNGIEKKKRILKLSNDFVVDGIIEKWAEEQKSCKECCQILNDSVARNILLVL
nr:12326_t:CDS:2 [Entrophospora candida]CAG8436745.1 3098_t:CDS:2 [Entrophospora candida]